MIFRRLAGGAELLEAVLAQGLHGVQAGLQELARIELGLVFLRDAAELAGHGQAAVGIDVDLAHPVA